MYVLILALRHHPCLVFKKNMSTHLALCHSHHALYLSLDNFNVDSLVEKSCIFTYKAQVTSRVNKSIPLQHSSLILQCQT